jgi:hypothetical protein
MARKRMIVKGWLDEAQLKLRRIQQTNPGYRKFNRTVEMNGVADNAVAIASRR